MMENYQFWTLVGMLAGGFAWMIRIHMETNKEIRSLDSRLSHIEGYLEGYFGNSRRAGGEK